MGPPEQPSSIQEVLASAYEDVRAAEIPDELLETAFSKAVDLYATRLPASETPARRSSPVLDTTAEAPNVSVAPLVRIAERLSVDDEAIADVYNDGDGNLEIVVPPSKLPRQNAAATKELALLVAAGRQAAGYDDGWTPYSAIRRVCEDYRKLDASNFATTMREMEDVFATRSVSARKREVRVARPGWDRAAQLVARLARTD